MLGLFSVNGVVVAGFTGSGFGLCLGWFGCYRDLTLFKNKKKKKQNKKTENEGITCKIADISSKNITSVETDEPTSLSLSLAALPICCDPPAIFYYIGF